MQNYFMLYPEDIADEILKNGEVSYCTNIMEIPFLIYPHVYPSDRFRTTNFLLENIQELVKDAVVCDMGCCCGVVGEFALSRGAKKVVHVDINPYAVKNALANKQLHNRTDAEIEIYQSDCFDNVPTQIFDLLIFNIPFHSENYTITDPLQYAFHDPQFLSFRKFMKQVLEYSHVNSKIIIAFSNKGDIQEVELIFDMSGMHWSIWRQKNTDQMFDNRIYLLHR
jgi:methylase of polypeptide subunit release factors